LKRRCYCRARKPRSHFKRVRAQKSECVMSMGTLCVILEKIRDACARNPLPGFCEGEARNKARSNRVTLLRPKGRSTREYKADLHLGAVLSTRRKEPTLCRTSHCRLFIRLRNFSLIFSVWLINVSYPRHTWKNPVTLILSDIRVTFFQRLDQFNN
jgi:hypothetical protein